MKRDSTFLDGLDDSTVFASLFEAGSALRPISSGDEGEGRPFSSSDLLWIVAVVPLPSLDGDMAGGSLLGTGVRDAKEFSATPFLFAVSVLDAVWALTFAAVEVVGVVCDFWKKPSKDRWPFWADRLGVVEAFCPFAVPMFTVRITAKTEGMFQVE